MKQIFISTSLKKKKIPSLQKHVLSKLKKNYIVF